MENWIFMTFKRWKITYVDFGGKTTKQIFEMCLLFIYSNVMYESLLWARCSARHWEYKHQENRVSVLSKGYVTGYKSHCAKYKEAGK